MKKFLKIFLISILILTTALALFACTDREEGDPTDNPTDVPREDGGNDGGSDGGGTTPPTSLPDKDGISATDNLFVFELNEEKDGAILKGVSIRNPVVVIPSIFADKPVKEIGEGVFHANQVIEEITIPATVEKIGARAFSSCYALKKVAFQENSNLKTIGYRAFYNAEYLESINLPEGLEKIEGGAFELCTALTTFDIPTTLATIGAKALHCAWYDGQEEGLIVVNNVAYSYKSGEEIVAVTIPSTISKVADEAFYGNDKISAVFMERGITSIGSKAFANMPELLTVSISVENEVYSSVGNCIVEKATNKLLATTKSTILPNTLKIIGEECYAYNVAVGELVIPSSVETIEKGAFKCSSITKITLPEGLKIIEEELFLDASSLEEVNVPASVEEIKLASFNGCESLERVAIDSGEILELCIGKLNAPAGLMAYAKVVYVKEGIEQTSSYLTAFFSEQTTDKLGYKKYVINP